MNKYAIAGYGVEGKANYEYFSKFGETLIFDERGDFPEFDEIPEDAIIVRSPGVNPNKLPRTNKIWSGTNEFFAKCPAPIIGVTGSKGKGTTSSFVAEILRAAGKTVHLVGNIGQPALAELEKIKKEDFVVYELSSFQLWDIQKSPHVAIITMIEPDHLDNHENMADYVLAKANIAKFQSANDYLIYNANNQIVREIAEQTSAKKIKFPEKKLAKLAENNLPGEHNLFNAEAAILAVQTIIPKITDNEIKTGLDNFTGLPHRLKFVREVEDVKFYDDSIATTPGSVVAAIKSFDEPKILILGGSDKGAEYFDLGREIENSNVKKVFTIGENGERIANEIRTISGVEIHFLKSKKMNEIVMEVNQNTEPGDVVILSPAAASFDMFKSYADRGEQFIDAVNKL